MSAKKSKVQGSTNPRDVIAAIMIAAIGLLALVEAQNYNFGSLRNPGPALFPTLVGLFLVAAGGVLGIQTVLWRGEEADLTHFHLRPLLAIPGSVGVFAVTVENFGLVPAVAASILVACLAEPKVSITRVLALAVTGSLFSVVIFVFALGLPITIWR